MPAKAMLRPLAFVDASLWALADPIAAGPAPRQGPLTRSPTTGLQAIAVTCGRFYGFYQVLMWALAGPIAAQGPLLHP